MKNGQHSESVIPASCSIVVEPRSKGLAQRIAADDQVQSENGLYVEARTRFLTALWRTPLDRKECEWEALALAEAMARCASTVGAKLRTTAGQRAAAEPMQMQHTVKLEIPPIAVRLDPVDVNLATPNLAVAFQQEASPGVDIEYSPDGKRVVGIRRKSNGKNLGGTDGNQ